MNYPDIKPRILILDTDETSNHLLKQLLESTLHEVKIVHSFKETMAELSQNTDLYSLIIADVFLPDNQFDQLIKQLKGTEQTQFLPILAITGKKDDKSKQVLSYVFDLEIDDIIFKPIDPTEFVMRVFRLIKIKDTYNHFHESIHGSKKIVTVLEKKLKDISEIYKNLKKGVNQAKRSDKNSQLLLHSLLHDIKSPLTSISLTVDLVISNNPDLNESDQEILNDMKSTVSRISKMISDFLDNFKEKNEHQIIAPVKWNLMDPSSIMEIILREFYPEANTKDIYFDMEMDEKLKEVTWDHNQILRVIFNLVDNALKFSSQHNVINLKLHQENQFTIFTIADNGIGIERQELEKIFEIFYRTNQEIPGYGIGLYYCKKIIDMHHGKIEIHSELHKGTKVTVILPNNPEVHSIT